MAVPAWPAGVPYDPDWMHLSVPEPHKPLVVTEVEDGPEIMREQSQTIIQKINYRIALSSSQWATLEAFFQSTLSQGKSRFTMPVLLGPDAAAFSTRLVYLHRGHWDREKFADDTWLVTFTLCVFPVLLEYMTLSELLAGDHLAAETETLIAAMTTQPTAARAVLINDVIVGLKDAGVWAKLEALWVFASHASQAANLNWKTPASNIALPQNAPAFTADRGYQGNGTSSYVDLNIAPAGSVGFMSYGFWSRTAGQGNAEDLLGNNVATTVMAFYARTTSDLTRIQVNDGTLSGVANTDGSGLFSAVRASSTVKRVYRNAVQLGADFTVTATLKPTFLWLGAGNTFSTRQYAMAFVAAGLTATENVALYNAIYPYMVGVGAAA